MKICLIMSLGLMLNIPLLAQSRIAVYASVLSNKRYIVGADNPPTGLQVSLDDGQTWTSISWPNIRCFSFDLPRDSDGRVIYVAAGNGVLKTVDGGRRWRQTTDWRVTEVLEVRVDPQRPETVYLASAYGVWKSTDGGGTWQERNNGLSDTYTSTMVIDRANTQHLLVGGENGVWASTDAADRWRQSGLQGEGVRVLVQDPVDPRKFFAGTENQAVLVSTDGGRHWRPSRSGLDNDTVYDIAIDPKNPQVLYAGTFEGGVYKSVDGGATWEKKSAGLTNLMIHAVAVHPTRDLVFAGSINGGIFRSTDGGEHWEFAGLEGAQVWRLRVVALR